MQGGPQYGGDLVAYQPVNDPPGRLGIHQVLIDTANLFHGRGDTAFGDLGEFNTFNFSPGYFTGQVAGNGFPFPVRICSDQYPGRVLGFLFEISNKFFSVREDLQLNLKIIFNINSQFIGGQVFHVPHTGGYFVITSQILLNGPCLGRGLNNQ